MAIIKIMKKDNPFLQIDKTSIEDERLSWTATGLLTYLIGRPDNWEIRLSQLSKVKKCGKDKTRNALNELRNLGYVHYFEIRENGKIKETTYLVFEVPTSMEKAKNLIEVSNEYKILYKPVKPKKPSVSQKPKNPISVNTTSENPTLIIIDSNNKRKNNNKTTTKKKKSSGGFLENYLKEKNLNINKKIISSINLKDDEIKNIINFYIENKESQNWGIGALVYMLKNNNLFTLKKSSPKKEVKPKAIVGFTHKLDNAGKVVKADSVVTKEEKKISAIDSLKNKVYRYLFKNKLFKLSSEIEKLSSILDLNNFISSHKIQLA